MTRRFPRGRWPRGRWAPLCGLATWLAAWPIASVAASALEPADVLISGGTVYDGTEDAARVADVVISGDRIAYVGPGAAARYSAARVVDARGKIVSPGFIDPHAHPDTYIRSKDAAQRVNAPWLFQGATTLLIGVDGGGTPEIARESAELTRLGIGTNVAMYVGFSPVRERILGESAREPSAAELDRMRALVAQGMCEGAIGFSTGLFYAPQRFAKTEEVIELAREAAKRGGIYDTHQRDESSYDVGLLRSTEEAIRIGREAGLPVHIAHIKALGVDVQGEAPRVIALIDAARRDGVDVTADQYPWAASGTSLEASLLPGWSVDGGRDALLARLAKPADKTKILDAMRENLRRRGGARSLLFTAAGSAWAGKTLEQLAAALKIPPVEAALHVIEEGRVDTSVASFNMVESDIRLFMQQPWVVTSSDGSDGHPRQYGTFPRKYAQYVKADETIPLGRFIRNSSGRTADLLKLEGRGYLRAGYFADVLVFDPERFAPKADYTHPAVLSQGVAALFVNGREAIRDGELTGERAGRVLLRPAPFTDISRTTRGSVAEGRAGSSDGRCRDARRGK